MRSSKRVVIILIIFANSCYTNPPERNKIVFIDKIEDVQDSLLKMKELLIKLPKRIDSLNTNYRIKNGKLLVNDSLFNDSFIRDSKMIFTNSEKNNFINLSYYLNKNHLSVAYFDQESEIWRFIYREIPDRDFDDLREITVLDSTNDLSHFKLDTILDEKVKIFLLAPKDAKIR